MSEFGKIYALLIAVGNYEKMNSDNLHSYRSDLALMVDSLQNGLKVNKENIRIIGADGTATVRNLVIALKEFTVMLKENDTFLFYFSGHGQDGNLIFSDNIVDLQSVINSIQKTKAKNKMIILDCCDSGSFSQMEAKLFHINDSIDSFAGHGTAVLASSAADEPSRLGPGGNHSLFTGVVSTAFMSRHLIRRGKLSLSSILDYVRSLMDTWNKQNPEKSQQPIIRTSMGGTIYFDVEEYNPYQPKQIHLETKDYIIHSVKPLSSLQEKRLCAFILPKIPLDVKAIVKITKDVVKRIRYENVFSTEKSERYFSHQSAKAIWCYFGMDERDMINSLYCNYSIWAIDRKTAEKYYRKSSDAAVHRGIYIYTNGSYEMLRRIQDNQISIQEYEQDVKRLLAKIISKAEQFISSVTELMNHTLSLEEAMKQYSPWIKEVYQQYYRLTDVPVAPNQIHDWAEEVLSLAGWVIDMSLALKNVNALGIMDERSKWLFQNATDRYYESLEKLKKEENKQ